MVFLYISYFVYPYELNDNGDPTCLYIGKKLCFLGSPPLILPARAPREWCRQLLDSPHIRRLFHDSSEHVCIVLMDSSTMQHAKTLENHRWLHINHKQSWDTVDSQNFVCSLIHAMFGDNYNFWNNNHQTVS